MRSSPVTLEILSRRLTAVVEEMAETIRRTSFSVFVKQTADFGTCLVTPDGEVFAAPRSISGNLMIGLPARAAIESLAPYAPGDIGISNDPDATGGLVTHLPDVWTWAPLYAEGRVVAYAFSFVHASDIGGSVPGSISWTHTDRAQEGVLVPPAKLYDAGRENTALLRTVLANTRVPEENRGDIDAQITGLTAAQRRIDEIVAAYGAEALTDAMADLLDEAAARAAVLLSQLGEGTYRFVDYVEGLTAPGPDGQETVTVPPTRLALELTLAAGRPHLSFKGTSPQVAEAINLPTGGAPGHYMLVFALVNYLVSKDPGIPYNSGLVRAVTADLPPGSVVNPGAGATCGVRAAVFFRIMDCVLGCLAQAAPADALATGSGAVAIATVAHTDPVTGRRRVAVGQPLTGGSGGRPGLDGLHGTSFTGGWLRNVPNELLEQDAPVLVEEYRYRPGSGGAGRHPGGAGITLRLRALADGVTLAVRGMERLLFAPWGLHGGGTGVPGRAVLNPGTPGERRLGRVNVVTLAAGDVLLVETAGGGGLGPPGDRPAEAVAADVARGLLDDERARSAYGVVLRPDGTVDGPATAVARTRTAAREPVFTLGAARTAYERRWPERVQRALVDEVAHHPPTVRAQVYRAAYIAADAGAGPDRPVTTEAVREAVRRAAGQPGTGTVPDGTDIATDTDTGDTSTGVSRPHPPTTGVTP
ncbi:hydantoinase B/oxoprolinase family protein [Streptomyces paludis]|uniref:Hydantoinase B/oxoprolinase family protein n=1 Tax=Streptomyces paludis TaxID=2282738 RepID=A0A345HYS3_9ACTN|nr:hydantoinase B/oxoprolinase family protein [Streptomyces paludis]AXG81847.1 hydantoinase B/oxoprolinase family protein [Streptomyces paludis]